MTKLAIAAALIFVAIGAFWYSRKSPAAPPTAPTGSATPTSAAAATASPTRPDLPPPPQHVRKLASAEERGQLVERIAAAQQRRKSARTIGPRSAGEASEGTSQPGEVNRDSIKSAMHEVLPFLAECYSQARAGSALPADHLEIHAHFTLAGDPDVGTMIDAKQLFDDDKHALPATLDDCIRGTLQTLELPPLGDGDTVEVDYPLMFSDG